MVVRSSPYPRCAAYKVFPDGRVLSNKRGSKAMQNGGFLKGKVTKHGYTEFLLSIDGKRVYQSAHRMVLETFRGPCPFGMEACHADDDPANNCLDNLRWDTKSENAKDKVRLGVQVGVTHGMCRLTEEQVLAIRQKWDSGGRVCDIAREFGIGYSHAYGVANRITWKHLLERQKHED